ncbi:uncharacterized protein LOC125226900 [Leguminivora glycinivorella]|uniref:uncharacterized protein LOC125226900 n=1 Tax=Leguminivora glycinivorella TaxID=1035111 RepID=UPI00200E6687|nr:uncharacterized protein LOC125226900 [Leguminivora glycinivorella]
MPDDIQIRRYESMLFNYGTVQRTDYRENEIKAPVPTLYREKPPKRRAEFKGIKDTQTMSERLPIPFDLFIKPKDVVKTNPRIPQKPFVKPEDLGREEAQRTRPRLVMTPAVSMDDIDSKQVRDLLIKDIYKSTVRIATEEGVALTNYKTVRAPLPDLPAPANPITLPKLNAQYVSPEWRMDSVSWDNRQLRTYCDATQKFWLERTPKCSVCDDTAARTAQQKMKDRMKMRA